MATTPTPTPKKCTTTVGQKCSSCSQVKIPCSGAHCKHCHSLAEYNQRPRLCPECNKDFFLSELCHGCGEKTCRYHMQLGECYFCKASTVILCHHCSLGVLKIFECTLCGKEVGCYSKLVWFPNIRPKAAACTHCDTQLRAHYNTPT